MRSKIKTGHPKPTVVPQEAEAEDWATLCHAEAGKSLWVWGQPGLQCWVLGQPVFCREILSQNKLNIGISKSLRHVSCPALSNDFWTVVHFHFCKINLVFLISPNPASNLQLQSANLSTMPEPFHLSSPEKCTGLSFPIWCPYQHA